MTAPHQMNCRHEPYTWCLECVGEINFRAEKAEAERDEAFRTIEHQDAAAVIWEEQLALARRELDEATAHREILRAYADQAHAKLLVLQTENEDLRKRLDLVLHEREQARKAIEPAHKPHHKDALQFTAEDVISALRISFADAKERAEKAEASVIRLEAALAASEEERELAPAVSLAILAFQKTKVKS